MIRKKSLLLFMILLGSICCFAQAQKVKIACVGNSVTYGATLADPATQSYPAVLQKMLGDGYQVGNFGHSGATLLRHGHNPYFKTPEFQKAIAMHPDIVVIHLGLNDTDPRDFPNYRDDFIPDYNWLIDTFRRASPKARIYICKMTPIFTGHPRFLSSTQAWYKDLQTRIREVARINNCQLIDLYSAFHNRPDLFTDPPTLHPNKAGAYQLATVMYQYLTGQYGGLQVADIFSDNMVLQRDKSIPVWGLANAGQLVTVAFHGQQMKTKAGADGKWRINLPALEASSRPQQLKVNTKDRSIEFHNILVGDVWLCSGQSNMYFKVRQSLGGDSLERHARPKKNIRLFKYTPYAATDNTVWDSTALRKANELDFFSGSWTLNNPADVAEFSAVGYVFGHQIQEQENIPVGLIELAVGGSPLISWLDRTTLEEDPAFEPALSNWRHSDYLMAWNRERANKNLEKATSPFQRHPFEPCFNYEAGVAKIKQFPIKGVIWYQGESDAGNAELYSRLFPVFVQNWRASWGKDLPFYYVQLSSIDRPSWNYFRDAQRRLLHVVPHTAMAVTSDLGDSLNVHYPDKIPVGLRLAKIALKNTYHHSSVICSGPTLDTVRIQGHQLILNFSHAEGLTTSDQQPPRGFQIINKRGELHPVIAKIRRNQVVLQLPESMTAKQVVYSWKPFSHANLVNGAGLPASTFSTTLKNK